NTETAGGAGNDEHVGGGGGPLRDDGPERRAADTEARAVDEGEVQANVAEVGRGSNGQWRTSVLKAAQSACHGENEEGCRQVGEEDRQADRGTEDSGRHTKTGELWCAEMADDRRVCEEEEGLGDEGAEGGHGEAQDLAVVGMAEWRPGKRHEQ